MGRYEHKTSQRTVLLEKMLSVGFFLLSLVLLEFVVSHNLMALAEKRISLEYELGCIYSMILSFLTYPFKKWNSISIIRKFSKTIALACFSVCLFFLVCLILLNYYYNCSEAVCATIHSVLSPVYLLDFALVFRVLDLFPAPYSVFLFVQCAYLFLLLLGSFAVLRLRRGVGHALFDSFQLGLFSLALYESGIFFLDSGWWNVHVTVFGGYPVSEITNENLFLLASILLIACLVIRSIQGRYSKRSSRKQCATIDVSLSGETDPSSEIQ